MVAGYQVILGMERAPVPLTSYTAIRCGYGAEGLPSHFPRQLQHRRQNPIGVRPHCPWFGCARRSPAAGAVNSRLMRRKLFTLAAGVSAVLCVGLCVLWATGGPGYLSHRPTVYLFVAGEIQAGA